MIHFFLGFICSIGSYAYFYQMNRPPQKWRAIVLLLASILGYPLCELWVSKTSIQIESDPSAIGYVFYLLWLMVCILMGTNRNRTLVGAAFLLSFGFIVQMPLGFIIGYITFPSNITTNFLEVLHQFPKLRYTLLFFVNISITGCCFLLVYWLKKIPPKLPFKLCAFFTFVFIFNTAINQIWWVYSITTNNNIPLLVLAFLALLLTAMPFFIMHLFIQRAARINNNSDGLQMTSDLPRTVEIDGDAELFQRLSRRELEVVETLLAGYSTQKEIAEKLNISINTVKFHLKNIYQITGVNKITSLLSLFGKYRFPSDINHPKLP